MYQKKMFKLRYCRIILVLFFLSLMIKGCVPSELDSGTYVDMDNCTLTPVKQHMKLKLDTLIEGNNRLIYLDVTVIWNSQPPAGIYPEQMALIFTIDDSGRHLLLLNDHFQDMSLGTLSYGIVEMPLRLTQEPKDCLGNMTAKGAENLLKFVLLNLPTKSKDDEENVVSPFYICTGSLLSNGTCCNITYSGDNVNCYDLSEDTLSSIFNFIVVFLAFIAWTHCVYLIPQSLYEEHENTYKVHKTRFNLKLEVLKGQTEENWLEVTHVSDPLLSDITEKIGRKLTSTQETNESNDTETAKTCDLYVELQSINRKHNELVSELKSAEALCKTLCNFNAIILKVFFIILCSIPVIVRVIVGFIFNDLTTLEIVLYIFHVIVIFVYLIMCFLTAKGENMFVKSLQQFHKTYTYTYVPLVALLISQLNVLLDPAPRSNALKFGALFLIFTLEFMTIGAYVILCCTVFYTECVAYMILGFVLNYELLTDKLILIVMILTYAYNCIQNVYQKRSTFNQQVFKIFRDNEDSLYAKSLKENENVAIILMCRNDEQGNRVSTDGEQANRVSRNDQQESRVCRDDEHENRVCRDDEQKNRVSRDGTQETESVRLVIRKDGKAVICSTGVFIFYKYQMPERLSYMHLPESYLDQLASIPAPFTPGSKKCLFIKSCKDIIIMLLSFILVFVTVSSFGRIHDISATAHTLATVLTSAALIKMRSIFLKETENNINDNDMHFKTLIMRNLNEFKDSFEEFEINIQACQFPAASNSKSNMAVKLRQDEFGNDIVQSWYIKREASQNNTEQENEELVCTNTHVIAERETPVNAERERDDETPLKESFKSHKNYKSYEECKV